MHAATVHKIGAAFILFNFIAHVPTFAINAAVKFIAACILYYCTLNYDLTQIKTVVVIILHW